MAELRERSLYEGSERATSPSWPGQATNPFEPAVPQQAQASPLAEHSTGQLAAEGTASQSGDAQVDLLTRILNANWERDITRLKLAKMPALDWITRSATSESVARLVRPFESSKWNSCGTASHGLGPGKFCVFLDLYA